MKLKWHHPLPLDGWFLATRSRELKPGGVLGVHRRDRPLVLSKRTGWSAVFRESLSLA
jgi:hypothetical protein